MPAANPPRWITVRKVPYDYRWPDRSAITAYTEPGEYLVKAEVADDAVGKGFASEGKADSSDAKAPKGKRPRRAKSKATAAGKPVKQGGDAATPDIGSDAGLGGADMASPDRAGAGGAVDPAAG